MKWTTRAASAAALAATLTGCAGNTPPPVAAPSTPPTTAATTTTAPRVGRDTEIAIRECVDKMSSVGLALLTIEGNTTKAHTAMEKCDNALTLIKTDKNGVLGPTQPNKLAALISERNVAVSAGVVKHARGTLTSSDAADIDAPYTKWQADIEALLK